MGIGTFVTLMTTCQSALTAFRYIGCFEDAAVRILPILLPLSNSNSPIECAARCQVYLYSGTEVRK
ncbi:hypothetical protein DPMN_089639 [Dreissena polymorpha]|uniref:Uncharacterized protein n=1 Tax=Dreissena polymorpha TaxID=45954 RepID=A0A9D4QXM2_DREPO|nr:hypothetical protein DPMN_089639 [Dreissena polymorpha]